MVLKSGPAPFCPSNKIRIFMLEAAFIQRRSCQLSVVRPAVSCCMLLPLLAASFPCCFLSAARLLARGGPVRSRAAATRAPSPRPPPRPPSSIYEAASAACSWRGASSPGPLLPRALCHPPRCCWLLSPLPSPSLVLGPWGPAWALALPALLQNLGNVGQGGSHL